jgi:predicted SnoaL-like aldol condensation-catalyzing enzyme
MVNGMLGAEEHGDGGKIVEHWSVLQAVPDESANDNSMF